MGLDGPTRLTIGPQVANEVANLPHSYPPNVEVRCRFKADRRAALDPQARLRPPCRIMQIWVVANGLDTVAATDNPRAFPYRSLTAAAQ